MAKFELKFIDACDSDDFIKTELSEFILEDGSQTIEITGEQEGNKFLIFLDKSTAIKFAKTLRTEINKITEREVKNG
jgi:hypothetical protein